MAWGRGRGREKEQGRERQCERERWEWEGASQRTYISGGTGVSKNAVSVPALAVFVLLSSCCSLANAT